MSARKTAEVVAGFWLFVAYVHIAALPGGRKTLDRISAKVTGAEPRSTYIRYGASAAPVQRDYDEYEPGCAA